MQRAAKSDTLQLPSFHLVHCNYSCERNRIHLIQVPPGGSYFSIRINWMLVYCTNVYCTHARITLKYYRIPDWYIRNTSSSNHPNIGHIGRRGIKGIEKYIFFIAGGAASLLGVQTESAYSSRRMEGGRESGRSYIDCRFRSKRHGDGDVRGFYVRALTPCCSCVEIVHMKYASIVLWTTMYYYTIPVVSEYTLLLACIVNLIKYWL